MCCFRSENSDALLYLKLWCSFYIRVEYQSLHENNLAKRGERASPAKIDPLWTLRRFRRPSAAAAHRLARRIWCTGSTTLRASPVSSAIIHWHHWLHTRLHSHQPDDRSIGGRQLPHRVRSPQRWWNHTTTTIPLSRENTKE
jgi:hypothetical protein